MELHDALSQIDEIRSRMARAQVFRGYRALTAGFSGVVAFAAAAWQAAWISDPGRDLSHYLFIWWTAAVVSLVVVGAEMVVRYRKTDSRLGRDLTHMAVQQFVPCLAAGFLLTFMLVEFRTDQVWMLPGLWAILFAMGLFASRPVLPRTLVIPAGYYLLAGLIYLAKAHGPYMLWPWAMGLTFGIGQFLIAGVLYWSLERNEPAALES